MGGTPETICGGGIFCQSLDCHLSLKTCVESFYN